MCIRFGSDPRADLLGTKHARKDVSTGALVLNHKPDMAGDQQEQQYARAPMHSVKSTVKDWISNRIR